MEPLRQYGWKYQKSDELGVRKKVEELCNRNKTHTAEEFMHMIKTACDRQLINKIAGKRNRPVYSWNQNISELRKLCVKKRRKMARLARATKKSGNQYKESKEEYNASKANLNWAIVNAKKQCSMSVCEEIERDIWGLG
ncbi:hypothetical protein M8J76_005339 [Diaphorina citri]|nr:hypothetical protein M8J76_005339 [Diaphorina citri]